MEANYNGGNAHGIPTKVFLETHYYYYCQVENESERKIIRIVLWAHKQFYYTIESLTQTETNWL